MDSRETEAIVCPSCTGSCPADAHFRPHCRNPITPYAATGPFESIFAEGAAYRSAVNQPDKPIVLVGTWLLFGAMTLYGLAEIGMCLAYRLFQKLLDIPSEDLIRLGSGIVVTGLGSYVVHRTTRNFIQGRSERSGRDEG